MNPKQQFISIRELKEEGYSYYDINKLKDAGKLAKVNRKYYENLDFNGEPNGFYAVSAASEKGVVCLLSAAAHYNLTEERPSAVDVALPRGTRIPAQPNWPLIEFYLFSKERHETGIRIVNEDGNVYRIYDMEKTVCDIFFYRNKIGFESAIKVLKNYMRRRDRNINHLMKYAEKLRVKNTMRPYLEMLV